MSTEQLKRTIKPNAAPPQTRQDGQIAARVEHLKTALMGVKRQIESLLTDKARTDKFMAGALVVAQDKTLANCRVESIVSALVGVAMLDLSVDKNIGHVYLVKYKDDVNLQIGAKGYIQLLFRAGWLVKAYPVYTCDDFSMSFNGWDNNIELIQNIDEREEDDKDWVYQNLRGVYVVARHSETKDEYSEFVPRKIIEKLRKNSPNQQVNPFTKEEDRTRLNAGLPIGIWRDWYAEMAMAKAVKKLSKKLPLGDRRAELALAVDDKTEMGERVNYMKTAEASAVVAEVQATTVYTDEPIDSVVAETTPPPAPEAKPEPDAKPNRKPETAQDNTDWEDLLNNADSLEAVNAIFASIPDARKPEFKEQLELMQDSFR